MLLLPMSSAGWSRCSASLVVDLLPGIQCAPTLYSTRSPLADDDNLCPGAFIIDTWVVSIHLCTLQARKQAEELALKVVHQHFRPEFLNRIDETVVFEALSPAQLREIARLQVCALWPQRSSRSARCVRATCRRALLPTGYFGSC